MKFLTFTYWISSGSLVPAAQKGLFFILGALAVSIIVLKVAKSKHKRGLYFKILNKLENFCWGNLIIGAFLAFFTYQAVYVLSSRAWFLIWGIIILIWLYQIIKAFRKVPELREKLEKEKELKKYIP